MGILAKYRIILLAWAAIAFFAGMGCTRKGCIDPQSSNYDPEAVADDGSCIPISQSLTLHFKHVVGGVPLDPSAVYQDSLGRSFQITMARFYVSGMALQSPAGAKALNSYLHVDSRSDESYTWEDIDLGTYSGMGLQIGIDSITNHGDPTLFPPAHALSASNPASDHWNWNNGYVFLRIEGRADTSVAQTGNLDADFFLHIATDAMLTDVILTRDFVIEAGEKEELAIQVDWLRAFSGYDFNVNTSTTDNVRLARRIINNLASGIVIL